MVCITNFLVLQRLLTHIKAPLQGNRFPYSLLRHCSRLLPSLHPALLSANFRPLHQHVGKHGHHRPHHLELGVYCRSRVRRLHSRLFPRPPQQLSCISDTVRRQRVGDLAIFLEYGRVGSLCGPEWYRLWLIL